MRKLLYFLLCGGLVLSAASCKKYLDIKPKGAFIPEKTSDYRLLLDETTAKEKSNGFFNSYGMDVMLDDDMSINSFSMTYYDANALNAFRYAENIYLDYEADKDWEALYNQIYTANMVTTQVMDSKGGTDPQKRQLMAEARVHRAYAYFILVNLYAKQYTGATAATDPGVPIRKGIDFEEQLPRASVQEVYDYIASDLSSALPDLPATPDKSATNRPVKPTAWTLLAKVSLFKNDAAAAHAYADSSLTYYHTLVDYNTLAPHPAYPAYILQYPINFQNPETLMEKTGPMLSPVMYAGTELLSLYDAANDLRYKAFFFPDNLFGLNFGSFSNEWAGRQATKGPSVPETYLIRAESSARSGNASAAMDDINLLRSFRYKTGSNYTLSAADAATALRIVKTERRREMAFRGSRFFDIRRYNAFDNDNITITHTLSDGTFTLPPNSNRTALAIGRKYIAQNPEIVQNPR
jgi:starch-binding outer membrane protein, SusD/RagB family